MDNPDRTRRAEQPFLNQNESANSMPEINVQTSDTNGQSFYQMPDLTAAEDTEIFLKPGPNYARQFVTLRRILAADAPLLKALADR